MTRRDLAVLAAWCAAVIALLAPVWARPGAVFFNHGDLYAYHVPLRSVTASALQEGRVPFWNPYIMLGVPHAANPQAALFYPPALLSAFFPVARALAWDQAAHLLWAGLGMFLLARAQRLDRAGAAVLASAYALSPFLVYRVTAGIPTLLAALAWAPWAWLAWLSGSAFLLGAVLALQLLSGHAQFLAVNGAGMALWGLLHPGRRPLLARLAAGGAAALALTAVQTALTAQFLRLSVRAAWSGASAGLYALSPAALLAWAWPGARGTPLDGRWPDAVSVFYETCGAWVGPVALLLAVLGLARGRRRAGAAALAAAGVFLGMGARGPLSAALLEAGPLSYLRTPSRWSLLSLWGIVLLAGAGWATLAGRRRRALALAAAVAGFAPLAWWDLRFLRPEDSSSFLAPRPEVAAALGGRAERVLTDPALANPNKTALYRLMNANGYEAFYPRSSAEWAAAAEGVPAADASRVEVTRWRSPAAARAGVAARLSAAGVERAPAWPLAAYVDAAGRRTGPDPTLRVERPERWRVTGTAPRGAAALVLSAPAYPGWHASVDGLSAPLSSWDRVFLAADPPPGDRELVLEFTPTAWLPLAAATGAAWAAWLALAAARAGAA